MGGKGGGVHLRIEGIKPFLRGCFSCFIKTTYVPGQRELTVRHEGGGWIGHNTLLAVINKFRVHI